MSDQTTPEAIVAAMRRHTNPIARIKWMADNAITPEQLQTAWDSFSHDSTDWTWIEAAAPTVDIAHLTHHVVRVLEDTRSTVAAFVDAADAMAWADMLTTTDTTPAVQYEVPGVDIPSADLLEPFLQQVRAAGIRTADA